MITLEQSVAIYARAMRAWFGAQAGSMALARVEQCRVSGDNEGVDVWISVADRIEALEILGEPRHSLQISPVRGGWLSA
jgi:hypothetical protein